MGIQIDRLDGLASSTAVKGPCRVATTENITLSDLQTIDGVALADGDRVLVRAQTDAKDNGIYVASTGNWRRSKDFSSNRDVRKGTMLVVTDGDVHESSEWIVTTENPVVFDTSEITFIETIFIYGDEEVKTANYTMTVDDNRQTIVANSASPITFTLPEAADADTAIAGQLWEVRVFNAGAGTLTVDGAGAETINGQASIDISQNRGATLWTNGVVWRSVMQPAVETAHYNNKADVEAADIDVATQSIELTGYASAGDSGGFDLYKRVGSEPSHDGKIQSNDGAWWELASRTPSVGAFGLLDSNTESANETALALLETFDCKAFDLGRDIPLPAGTYPQKLLQGNGLITKGGEPFPYNVPGQSARDYLHRTFGRIGNIDRLITALRSGAVKVAIWGDSIAEGLSQIDYEDSWAGLLEAYMRRTFPGVTWQFANFSISGTVIGNANSDTYVGAADAGSAVAGTSFFKVDGDDLTPPNAALWPGGSTENKSWHEHVEDWAPDLVILAFGMNTGPDGITNTYDNANALANIINNRIGGWTTVPSVVLVTPMLPTRNGGASTWTTVQAIADMMRGMAAEEDTTLLDANALCRSYLDGIDVARTRRRVIQDFDDYADWITLSGTRPSVASDVLTFAASGWVYRPTASLDGDWSHDIVVNGSDDVVDLSYRMIPASPGTGYILRVRRVAGSPSFVWYYGATALSSGALDAASTFRVRVKVSGARHEAWVNGVKVVDEWNFRRLEAGYHGFFATGAATVASFHARLGYPAVIGHPIFREEDLLGTNDFGSDTWSLGGHPLNHPGILGHRALYFDACGPLFRAIETELAKQPPAAVVLEVASTSASIVPDDYIEAGINATYSPQVSYVGGSTTDCLAASNHSAILTGASSCTVKMRKNGVSDQISQSFTFPFTGNWLVTVQCVATFNDPSARASLVATAIEVR